MLTIGYNISINLFTVLDFAGLGKLLKLPILVQLLVLIVFCGLYSDDAWNVLWTCGT